MTRVVVGERVPLVDLRASQRPLDAELDAVWQRVTRGAVYVGGPEVADFEKDWALACGTDHAIGVANGTDAIELALTALGVGPGDEVVVPANTFVATAEAVVATGATPVFADVDDSTLLLTPATLEAALGPRVAAVLVVHLYGQAADMDALGEVARRAGVALVEDCAQAHGARWGGRPVGSFGDAGCFSFYPGKNLGALGDGGAVVVSDAAVAHRVRQLADHGRSTTSRYEHDLVGRNSRLDALQAGVLAVKLRHLEEWNLARRGLHERYRAALDGLADARRVEQHPSSSSVHHLEVIRVPDRDAVLERLRLAGVDASVHYPVPCHRNRAYERFARGVLPVAEQSAREVLSLPMFPGMTEEQQQRVCVALAGALAVATHR